MVDRDEGRVKMDAELWGYVKEVQSEMVVGLRGERRVVSFRTEEFLTINRLKAKYFDKARLLVCF